MSSVEVAVAAARHLPRVERVVLETLERYIKRFRHMPLLTLSKLSGIPATSLKDVLSSLNGKGLVTLVSEGTMVGITGAGLDLVALLELADADKVVGIGKRIGVGKESDLYDGITPSGERVVLKFFRVGRSSFVSYKVKRPQWSVTANKYLASVEAAQREFSLLKKLYGRVPVPKPITVARHVVVMEHLEGDILAEIKHLADPEAVFKEVVSAVRTAYVAGVVNGDLSAFNIFITLDGRVLLIDWPQAVSKNSSLAPELLKRDIENICEFFSRKYGLTVDVEQVLQEILGMG